MVGEHGAVLEEYHTIVSPLVLLQNNVNTVLQCITVVMVLYIISLYNTLLHKYCTVQYLLRKYFTVHYNSTLFQYYEYCQQSTDNSRFSNMLSRGPFLSKVQETFLIGFNVNLLLSARISRKFERPCE